MPDLMSREFFLKYSRAPESFGLKPTRYSYYDLDRGHLPRLEIRSMLSTHEIALLFAIAKDATPAGSVVDLGPLIGASTWALCKGFVEAGRKDRSFIHSFDLWGTEGTYDSYLSEMPRGGAGSVLGQWMRVVAPWAEQCEPHQGDFLQWQWDGREIGVLFIDIAKSWALNNHVVSTMFPALRPGSFLIQQDYIHWAEYWIHIEMARFSKYFKHCQFLRGATSFYVCVETPPADLCAEPANSLPYGVQVALLDQERAKAPASVQQVMKCAAAKHAIENGDTTRARMLLDDVSVSPLTENALIEVSGIAKSNLAAAEHMYSQLS